MLSQDAKSTEAIRRDRGLRIKRFLARSSLFGIGVLGLIWCVFRFADARSEKKNEAFAFLDEFSDQKEKFERAGQRPPVSLRGSSNGSKSDQKDAPADGSHQQQQSRANENHHAPVLPSDFFVGNLELDLDDSAVESRLRNDVEYLADDKLEGRGIRTRGLELAAEYLAEQFEKAGLYTAWYSNSPFQEFQLLNASRKGAVQRVQLHQPSGGKYLLTPNVDFSSLLKTSMGTMTIPVAFAGYGITAPELGYDDYADIEVTGKAVVILRQEPQQDDEESPFDGRESSRYAPVYTKIQNAIAHGALAVILCDTERQTRPHSADDPFSSELLKVEFSDNAFSTTIPVIHCRRNLIDEYLSDYGMGSLTQIENQIDETLQPQSREVEGFQIGFEVSRNKSGRSVKNVLASIEPNGPTPHRTIVVGAHYDHLGRDGWGSLAVGADGEIHNGADDNASGTAVLMEVARQLATKRDKLKSRVLFIAFTAEELGLLGSKHYIRDPAVPLHETVAMINLDMVGRLRESVTIYGTGTAREWPTLIADSTQQVALKYTSRSSGYGPSDHAVFYERGVPVLHFFTGFHPQYHRPADDSELLNIRGMRMISNCVTDIVFNLASDDRHLSPGTKNDGLLITEGGISEILNEPVSRTPKFGVVLREIRDEVAVEITRVLPSSVAQNSGLLAGDKILQIGDAEVGKVEDVRTIIQSRKVGERVPVRIRRRSLELEIDVVF